MGRCFVRREKAGIAERERQQGTAGGRSDRVVTAGCEGGAVDGGPGTWLGRGKGAVGVRAGGAGLCHASEVVPGCAREP